MRIKLSVELAAGDDRDTGGTSYDVEAGVAYSYSNEIGLRVPTAAAFDLEPQVKEETLTVRNGGRTVTLLERRGPRVMARDDKGRKQELGATLLASETALGTLQDPARFLASTWSAAPCATGDFITTCAPTVAHRCASPASR